MIVFGATYDGTLLVTTVGNVPRIVLRCVRGLDDAPEVRGEDTVIPSAEGRVPRNRVWDRRVIELYGFVAGTGASETAQRADVRSALETLRTLFDPTGDPATLVVTLEDGSTATISARPINMVLDDGRIPTYREVSVELEAVEDDWVVAPAGS